MAGASGDAAGDAAALDRDRAAVLARLERRVRLRAVLIDPLGGRLGNRHGHRARQRARQLKGGQDKSALHAVVSHNSPLAGA